MSIALGTDDGVWICDERGAERAGLGQRRVTHVARDGERLLAAVPREGVFLIEGSDERRIFEGDARSCAVGPDGSYWAGVEPAMVHRSDDGGHSWIRCDAIDSLPTRADWTFPPPPHEPHVLSIAFLPGEPDCVLAGIEVGGVILSRDRGASWSELNAGVYVDVHSVRADPGAPGRLVAVTGRGFYASEDGGASWEQRMQGVGNRYTIGLQVNPERAGELLVTSGDRPPGLNGRVYHSLDAGRSWVELVGSDLPETSRRAPVPFFGDGAAWLATDTGGLLRAEDPRAAWKLVRELPVRINAVAAASGSSSVMH